MRDRSWRTETAQPDLHRKLLLALLYYFCEQGCVYRSFFGSEAMQNTSHAVMSQRAEARESVDNFPTPPWATRALLEHVISRDVSTKTCLEPACGAGHMSKVLEEYFGEVESSDIASYGYGAVRDFLQFPFVPKSVDWVITNPPFRLAEEFVLQALPVAREGVCMLTRTVFIESVGRYNRLFSQYRPLYFAQFSERVPMVKGRLDPKASTATGYCWLVWDAKASRRTTEVVWIPPCRKILERSNDYEETYSSEYRAIA